MATSMAFLPPADQPCARSPPEPPTRRKSGKSVDVRQKTPKRREPRPRRVEAALETADPRVGNEYPRIYFQAALSQLRLAKGETEAALVAARQALSFTERSTHVLDQGAAHRALAQAHEADGDDAAARAQFESSLAILGKIQSPPELAQSLLAYGRFQLKTNAGEGRELMERALAIFEEIGATGWIEETRTALAFA